MQKHVVMLGMMGAGKSTVGRWVAEQLSRPFIDTDELIVQTEGKSIPEIFAESGEEYFRQVERRCVREALDSIPAIISLGGGAFVDPETRQLVRERALSFYLFVKLAELVRRVGDGHTRPLLAGKDIPAILRQRIRERGPIYETANYVIPCGNSTPERVGFEVLLKLKETPGIATEALKLLGASPEAQVAPPQKQ